MWKEMTPEVEDMLIGHEVGHALYTTDQYLEPIRENPKMMGYMNILEDVRIEKLIKRKYPGLRKYMNEGYKQLNDRDFFEVKSIQNFDELLLIDKINLYFKVGYQCGVTFDADEKDFVNRAERCESVDEVIALAKEIYEYSKEKMEERKKQMAQNNPQDSESEEEEDADADPDFGDIDPDADGDFEEKEDENDKPANSNKSSQDQTPTEQDLESKTERAFKNKLDSLADDSTKYIYWKFDDDFYEEPVIGYRRILSETRTVDEMNADDRYDYYTRHMDAAQLKAFREQYITDLEKFKTESIRTVNYLVKEFEMKKSAQMYKRAQVSKLGSLDMRKVYAYKLKDDLFKRVTTLPQGKNHGMMMLVDWSGSMNDVLVDTLKQVINLAMFCQRVQIPFRVFAFTSSYNDGMHNRLGLDEYHKWSNGLTNHQRAKYERDENMLRTTDTFHLLELFSSKMTTSEFNAMTKRVLDYRFTWNDGYSTGGTPLNEAMVWVYNNIGEFAKHNNIEKMTFITLTDGEGSQFQSLGRRRLDSHRNEMIDGRYKRVNLRHMIRDAVTQKTYELGNDSTTQAEVVLRMIKDRYGVAVVGFHICRNHKRDLINVVRANIPNYKGDVYALIEAWRKDFRDNNFASVKNTGRDDLFIIPQSSTKIIEGDLGVAADAKASAIARDFGKYMNVKKTSRILLNRFVELIA
jgi:hypothetical protein